MNSAVLRPVVAGFVLRSAVGAACANGPSAASDTPESASVRAVVSSAADAHGGPVAALVVANSTGEIIAAAAGGDAAQAPMGGGARPAASLAKVVVLAAAVESGVMAHDVLTVPQCIRVKERLICTSRPGEVTVVEAAARSTNPAFVLLVDRTGPDTAVDYGARVGMVLEPSRLLPLGLDAVGMESVAALFVALANDGATRPIIGGDGSEVVGAAGRLVSSDTAGAMRKVLRAVVTNGTGTAADGPDEPYGKTGTAEGRTDAWFAGVSGDHTIVVWAGAGGASGQSPEVVDAPAGVEADYEAMLRGEEYSAEGGAPLTGGGLPARVFRQIADLLADPA